MIDIAAVENALRTWVKTASGLDDAHVYFNDQKIERPVGPYVTIKLDSLIPQGAVDSLTTNFDDTRDPGVEVEQRVDALREAVVSIQVWQSPTPVQLATTIQVGMRLPSVQDALDEAGVCPFSTNTVQNLARLLGTAFDGRAAFDAHFYITGSLSEFTGYITAVNGEIEISDSDRTTDVDYVAP